ncbi:MAG TPA: response regulator [Actinophytocola sp.]|uniref:response regulator n=1 Tax=Actinophytocola sp. TaxID=1872138 RepID=UPI002DB7B829|nr:response regulator [Actinophytocola sp.]HEU5475162.1 response regulator [Actinophytocola sp.]
MIRVLVVEDDPVAAEAHRQYVERVAGFVVVGVVHTGAEVLRALRQRAVDLLLLDFYLPDAHGLDVCRAVRAAGHAVDVIAVTSARDLAVVRAAVSAGVVQYLLKPFTFAAMRDRLERYARFLAGTGNAGEVAGQSDVDSLLATLRGPDSPALPKGMSAPTLDAVIAALRGAGDGLSAGGASDAIGVSRVTARRYLEYLADNGFAVRRLQYGQVGRPELWFHWSHPPR